MKLKFRCFCICFQIWKDDQVNHTAKSGSHVPYIWIVGGLGVVLALLVLCILVCICLRSSSCSSSEEDGNGHNFQILRKSGFFCGSGRYNCCRSGDFRQTNGETQVVAIPKGLVFGFIICGFSFKEFSFLIVLRIFSLV
jgi:hypothetical protein